MHFTKFAYLALLCLLTNASLAETVLFEGTYKGKYSGFTIITKRSLVKLNDGSYLLESRASNFWASLRETSHFTKQNDYWRPLEYVYKRRIVGAKAQETIEFNWEDRTAQYTHSKKQEQNTWHKLAPGILDPALYQLRIQRDLALGAEETDYSFIKRDKIRHYVIEQESVDDININGNIHAAIKVQRTDSDDDKQTLVWFLPELHYLLGKIVHVEEDGDTHQMVLTDFKVNQALLHELFGEYQPQASDTPALKAENITTRE